MIVGLSPLRGPTILADVFLDHIVGMLLEQLYEKNQNCGAMGSLPVHCGVSAKVPDMTP